MNPTLCAREDQTSAAVLSGAIDPETASHAQHCPTCSDILLVSEFLHAEAALSDQQDIAIPDARVVYQEGRVRAKQKATLLALRPIRIMKIIAVLAFLCSPVLSLLLPIVKDVLASWSQNLDFNFALAPRIVPATTSQAEILLGFTAATLLLSVSSWYMARQE